MRRWWLLVALLLSLGMNLGVLASLGLGRWRAPNPLAAGRLTDRSPNVDLLADRLGLDGPPRQQFLAMHRRFFETVRQSRTQLVRLRRQLHRELVAANPDRGKIDRLLRELARTQLRVEQALAENTLASREILSPQQRRLYFRFLASRLRPGQRNPSNPRPPGGR